MTTTLMAAAILAIGLQQGGAGGGLGGGGFGGGAGAQGGRAGDPDGETTKTHILTPGDKAEWEFEVMAGEVLILRAQSTNFDPAIEVVDEKGKVIAENDDEELGMQNAQLLVHFSKAGKYKAHVKNYRSNAGGQYEFVIRRFQSVDAAVGKANEYESKEPYAYFRVPTQKGKTYVLLPDGSYLDQVIRPNGKPYAMNPMLRSRLGVMTISAESGGDYYVRVLSYGASPHKLKLVVATAVERAAKTSMAEDAELAGHGLDIWNLEAKAGDFLTIRADSPAYARVYVEGATPDVNEGDEFVSLAEGKYPTSRTLLVRKPAKFRAYVAHGGPSPAKYRFTIGPAWAPAAYGPGVAGALPIGHARYYAVDMTAGDIVNVGVESSTFDAVLRILDAEGAEVAERDDQSWLDSNPRITFAVPKTGRYFLEVESLGRGGGGPFQLRLQPVPPQTLGVGETKTGTFAGSKDAVWDLAIAELGITTVRIKSTEFVGAALYDPDGAVFHPQRVSLGDGETMLFLKPVKPGRYRLWLTGQSDSQTYSLRTGKLD